MRPFILLSTQRSGSQYFESLLNSHPDIRCYGELFSAGPEHKERIARGISAMQIDVKELDALNEAPKAALRNVIWRNPQPSRAVGFRLFYLHLIDFPRPALLDEAFSEFNELQVLHLKRSNLLEQLVSYEIAKQTNVWQRRESHVSDKEKSPPSITLDPERCLAHFETVDSTRRKSLERLSKFPQMNISYEELAADGPTTVGRAVEFLGLSPVPLCSPLIKQAHQPIHEVVTNFAALKQYFSTTRWSSFFS